MPQDRHLRRDGGDRRGAAPGVANIGYSPTFEDRQFTVEVHILDFHDDIYGQKIHVNFVKRLRDEMKFAGIDALKRQIELDIDCARTGPGELMDTLLKANTDRSTLVAPRLRILTYPDKFLGQTDQAPGQHRRPGAGADRCHGGDHVPGAGDRSGVRPGGLGRKPADIRHCTAREGRSLHVVVNPRIIASEGEMVSEDEGCLSVPDFRADVKRAERVLVEGHDRHGKPVRIEAEGLHAIVLQHEIDHLEGRLFIERISSLKREPVQAPGQKSDARQ